MVAFLCHLAVFSTTYFLYLIHSDHKSDQDSNLSRHLDHDEHKHALAAPKDRFFFDVLDHNVH